MRRVIICFVISAGLAIGMHLVANSLDEFDLVQVDGEWFKVVPRGWPFTYFLVGRDPPLVIAIKVLANVVSVALALLLLASIWSRMRKKAEPKEAEKT